MRKPPLLGRDRGRGRGRGVRHRRRRRLDGARRVGRGAERGRSCSPPTRSRRTSSTSARCAIRSRSRREEDHLLPWLSRRVGTTLRAPDLGAFGLKLLGGRLLPGVSGPAALFMYEGASGERFTIYCSRLDAPRTRVPLRRQRQLRRGALDRRQLRLGGQRPEGQGQAEGRRQRRLRPAREPHAAPSQGAAGQLISRRGS